jgi:hypothetical protein
MGEVDREAVLDEVGGHGIPIALWELSLGLWLTFRGVRTETVPAPAADAPMQAPVL